MKIKEAIEIINGSTITVLAEESNGFLHMYRRDFKVNANWFLEMPIDVTNWDYICGDWHCLSNIEPQDLARVMDVIQQLLDTPVKERFPEKKYRLRWFDSDYTEDGCDEPATYLGRSTDDLGEMFWSTYTLDGAEVFTESQLEELKKENPSLVPAVDAMKEEVKGNED